MAKVWKDIEAQQKATTGKPSNSIITGTYKDQWFGDVVIAEQNGKLRFNSIRSPRLRGDMYYYKGNTYIVRWDDRSFDADAYVMFTLDKDGKGSGIKMSTISPLTDFSFDFQDLDLSRTK